MKHIRSTESVIRHKKAHADHAHTEKHGADPATHEEHLGFHTQHSGHDTHRDTYGPFGTKNKSRKYIPIQPGNKQLKNAAWFHRRILPMHHGRPPDAIKK